MGDQGTECGEWWECGESGWECEESGWKCGEPGWECGESGWECGKYNWNRKFIKSNSLFLLNLKRKKN